jgi:hypothetical protein
MRAVYVLALIVSALVLPLQPTLAVAQPSVSAAVELAVAVTQLDTRDVIVVEANHIDITIGQQSPKTVQSGIVIFAPASNAGVPTTSTVNCATVEFTGACPSPTSVNLSDCSDSVGPILNTYFLTPGGPNVGTFTDHFGYHGTVFNGSIVLTCQTVPPPPTSRRR